MTEVGCFVAANSVDHYRIGTCGRARPDIDVRVFDEDDREVGPGEEGEIVVRPRAPFVIMSGYYRRPDLTMEASRNLWFHTGDRGSIDEDGYLSFRGRLKELIRRGGEMISPVEIENALREMPGVIDCAIVGVPDAIQGEEIKAALVVSKPVESVMVREFLSDRFPAFMLPRYVEFVPAIPKTESEKIQRHKLQDLGPSVVDLRV